ncbi:MAG TPA: acyl-ACP--UDP-N-acetylglucosamine O-acyltransferase [Phycisphaerales bacterium]|nr:acyl-ACP--UDP-N-acetylglucosamine O-acyltransferase [Phycisphaerales bacterium]HMP37319.1 acyl-ACP--UDP-N-acetylglucosamine O-acyltransferase [Phycisphaerales bacterium]
MATIHPTAVVHSSARLADSVRVGPYAIIGPEVRIGEDSVVHSHAIVAGWTSIGEGNEIHSFAVVGGDPQDLKYRGETTWLTIGDRNIIREHATIHRGTGNGGGHTAVGSGNLIMSAAHIAHDCRLGDHIVLANQAMIAGHVRVEDGATISGGVGIHHYATVGTCAFIGGLTRVTKDVPPFMIVEGNPAEVRGSNHIAMKRRGFSEADIEAIKDCFRRLFRENGATMAEKMVVLRAEYPACAPVHRLCDFLSRMAEGVHGRSYELSRADDKRALRLEPLPEDDEEVL